MVIQITDVTFSLAAEGADPKGFVVPMLVMNGRSLSQPILGYNVIEQIVKTNITEQLEDKNKGRAVAWGD